MEAIWDIICYRINSNIWVAMAVAILAFLLGAEKGKLEGVAKIRGKLRRFLGKKWNFTRPERDHFMEEFEEHCQQEDGYDKLFKGKEGK